MQRLFSRSAIMAAICIGGCVAPEMAGTRTNSSPLPHEAAAERALVAPPVSMPKVRADFLKLIDRPLVAADAQVQPPAQVQGFTQIRFSFLAQAGQRVPGILLKAASATGRTPIIICMHGTGGSKNDELPFMRQLAQAGFAAVAIDGRYHGERAAGIETIAPMNAYETKIFQAWQASAHGQLKEHPLFYDTVWDIMRLIDYLNTRDDIDAAHIGIYGVSKGGIEAYLAAAVDTRITAAVPCIGVQCFQWGLDHNDWKGRVGTFQKAFDAAAREAAVATPDSAFVKTFYDRVMPGMDTEFDGPSIVPLIAPRALLEVNSDNDNHTPIGGVRETVDIVTTAYKAAGVTDKYTQIIQPGAGHKVLPASEKAAVGFYSKWLR